MRRRRRLVRRSARYERLTTWSRRHRWVYVVAILLLSKTAFKAFKNYEKQQKEGKDPVFDPKELEIENADFWEQHPNGVIEN